MSSRKCLKSIVLWGILLVFMWEATPAEAGRGRHPGRSSYGLGDNELVFEGGLAEPVGDQQDDFFATDTGFSTGTGYELGLRYRQYVTPNWVISPSFHYTRFGSFTGVDNFPEGDNLGFDIRLSNYLYGLDVQTFLGSPEVAVRPFLTGGVALAHNMYRDELEYTGVYNTSINAPAFAAGVGLKARHMEISAVYHWNRFDTSLLSGEPGQMSFNWDYAVVRVGFAFGRY